MWINGAAARSVSCSGSELNMATEREEREDVKEKKGGNELQEMVKGIDEWWFGEVTSRSRRVGGVKDLTEQRSPHLGPVRSPITQWWDQLQATLGTENQHRPTAPNGPTWLWPRQELDPGGPRCAKSVGLHYFGVYGRRPGPTGFSLCLRDFQQGKWTSSWCTSGMN